MAILIGIVSILLGVFSILMSIRDCEWFVVPKRRTTRWFYELVGRKGMRIYYIVLGIVMIVVGFGVALNILE